MILTDDPEDEEEWDEFGSEEYDHRVQHETAGHCVSFRHLSRQTRNVQSKHGDPSHHPIDNEPRRTEVAAERCTECKVQQREQTLKLRLKQTWVH